MDINRLRYFCTIAQTGSVRRAAELLRVSPPALSKATRLLEEELGVKLLARSGRNIQLTDYGKRLAKEASELLKQHELLKAKIEQSRVAQKEIRIATFEVFSTYFLRGLVHAGWSDDTPLILHEALPGELERFLVDRHVDIGITYMPVPLPGLDYLKVASVEMGVFSARGAFPGVEQEKLPFVVPVMPVSGSATRVRGLDGWPDDAYPRTVLHQVTLMESALELCRQGKAAGYFPVFVVNQHNAQMKAEYQLARRASPYKGRVCMTDVYIVKRKSDLETQTIKQVAKMIRLTCKS